MVPRARLLLSVFALAVCGCPAEMLGVELPSGGPDAISQEDLQRDTWMLSELGDRRAQLGEAALRVQSRMQQMHTIPGYGRSFQDGMGGNARVICSQKDGQRRAPTLVVVDDPGVGVAGGAAAFASLISVLKGFDVPGLPEKTLLACVLMGDDARTRFSQKPPHPLEDIGEIFIIGPVGGGTMIAEPATFLGRDAVRLRMDTPPQTDTLEAIDYRELRGGVVGMHRTIKAK
ncbi:MAG: hypothetical protein AAFV53_27930 [Myxococcota bacterium]